MSARKGVAVIIGVGNEGIGGHLARKFATEGYAVAIVGRTPEKLATIEQSINLAGHPGTVKSYGGVDASKTEDISTVFKRIKSDLGDPEVLIHNVGPSAKVKSAMEISPEELNLALQVTVGGLTAAQQVLPAMLANKKGTIIFTGATASLRGGAKFTMLAVPKFGIRALAQSLAREYHPQGVHVAHVVIDGIVDNGHVRERNLAPEYLDPAQIAEQFWWLHKQDRTAWTQEIELRPFTERF